MLCQVDRIIEEIFSCTTNNRTYIQTNLTFTLFGPGFGFKSLFGFWPGSCLCFRVRDCTSRPVYNSTLH